MSSNAQRENQPQENPHLGREESLKKKVAAVDTTMANSAEKQSATSTPSEATKFPDFSHLPAPWDQDCQDLWDEGAQTVQKPDGSHDNWDVVDWLLTRKGGADATWTELEEAQKEIEAMREEKFDVYQIREQMKLEKEVREAKEARRLANKMRFRPRSEWKEGNGKVQDKEGSSSDAQGAFGDEGNHTLGTNGDGKPKVQSNGDGKHE